MLDKIRQTSCKYITADLLDKGMSKEGMQPFIETCDDAIDEACNDILDADKEHYIADNITFKNSHLVAYYLFHKDAEAAKAMHEELTFNLRRPDGKDS